MGKFVICNKQNITQNLDKNITNEEIHQKELEDKEMIQLQDNNDVQFCNTTNLDNELQKIQKKMKIMMKMSQMIKFTIMMFNQKKMKIIMTC